MVIYILGDTSFLGINFYIFMKKQYNEIYLINYNNIECLDYIKDDDILINFCGINKGDSYNKFYEANYVFLQNIIQKINTIPFFVHISSLMVNGFENIELNELSNDKRWFIESKLAGEKLLKENYNNNKLCIIRPSNIYGYNCLPYYNNIITTLIYEKITKNNKINKINSKCIRNFISINEFNNCLNGVIKDKKSGYYNIISNNDTNLENILKFIYDNKIPNHIDIYNGEYDKMNKNTEYNNIIINENLIENLNKLENDMTIFLHLKEQIFFNKLDILSQPRGDMIEINNLESKRLYKITLTKHSVRGNHYHNKQIEEFFTNSGRVLYLLSHKDNSNIIYNIIINKNCTIKILPNIIHTLINDFYNNLPEIIISSTQEYIKNEIPDTEYISII